MTALKAVAVRVFSLLQRHWLATALSELSIDLRL